MKNNIALCSFAEYFKVICKAIFKHESVFRDQFLNRCLQLSFFEKID